MRQIDVDLKFTDEGEPTFYVSEDGSQLWAYTDTETADWKDVHGQLAAIESLNDADCTEVVILFDGGDTFIYASMSTVREG